MRIENEVKLDFSDVLIRPKRSTLSSRKEVSLERVFTFRNGATWRGVPIMAANMDGVGTFEMSATLSSHAMITCLVKSYNLDDFEHNVTQFFTGHTAISTGTSDKDFIRLQLIVNQYPDMIQFICIDIANGYSEHFGNFVAKVRKLYPTKTIIAGNVVTADMTQELILRGADIVKVGIGPGSVCTTRIQTGVGYPQLSAIIECADAAHGLGGHIIADGGCTCPGDIAKAFGAGADFVMLGGMLAGHTEGGGDIIEEVYETNHIIIDPDNGDRLGNLEERKKFVQFYGMSSETAMEKHHGGVAEYRSSEGRTVKVPYKGSVANTVRDILGGVRSTCTYVGAKSLKDLSKCTTFVRVNKQFNSVFLEKR
jgi:GMP reductase